MSTEQKYPQWKTHRLAARVKMYAGYVGCGCEECTTCLGREVRSLEKALQVMSDGRVSDMEEACALLERFRPGASMDAQEVYAEDVRAFLSTVLR